MASDRRRQQRRKPSGPQITPGFERRAGERRSLNLGAPAPSMWAHLADLVFFRSLGVGLLVHETLIAPASEWTIVMAGIMMFFMPDALRGRNSIGGRLILKKLSQYVDEEK